MSEPTPIIILDGGMSRELIRIGAPFQLPEWSAFALMHAPEAVQRVHSEFAAAGANVITTNSYALGPFDIGEDVFRDRGEELAALAGRLARNAADLEGRCNDDDNNNDSDSDRWSRSHRILVAGSLPPVFGSYKPELFDRSKVQEYLAPLVRGLSPYVDVWLGETLSLVEEARAVKAAVQDTGKPFWISFTLEDSDDAVPARLRSGESVVEAARWVVSSGASALLFNCSRPESMAAAVRDAKSVVLQADAQIQIGVYANAFADDSEEGYVSKDEISATRNDLDVHAYAAFARQWIAEGATIIGGCCGIGCDHIRQLAQEFGSGNLK